MLRLVRSFGNAIEGIKYAFLTERNFRFHIIALIIVLTVTLFLKLTLVEELLIIIAIAIVLIAELFNTAVENLTDLYTPEYHELAKKTKDIAAGAVMIAAVLAVIIGFFLFFRKLEKPFRLTIVNVIYSKQYIAFIALVTVISIVILIKSFTHKGNPLKGGFPSGHAAFSFGIWAFITLATADLLVSFLVFLLALIIAVSRIRDNVHNLIEVVFGGVLGTGIVIMVYRLFLL